MITINGKSFNIEKPLICRVRFDSSIFNKTESDFLFTSNINNFTARHNGYILNADFTGNINSKAVFKPNSNNNFFNDGDIFLIESNGQATKLYDASSKTNAVLLTEKCNCNCITCPQPPKKLDEKEWIDICLKAIELMNPNMECLGVTGGEPTIEWDGLINILRKCGIYLPNTMIQLLTNARIFTDYNKACEISKLHNNLFYSIPLYSDINTIHDKMTSTKGSFWDTVEGIYNIELTGKPIELRIVITKLNYDRLPQFAEFVYKTMPFVESVAFMGMEPIGKALKNLDLLWIDPIDYSKYIEKAVNILWKRDIPSMIFNHQLCTLPKNIWPLAKKSISEWKIIYVDECERCAEKENCGGFFFSSRHHKSKGIIPIL